MPQSFDPNRRLFISQGTAVGTLCSFCRPTHQRPEKTESVPEPQGSSVLIEACTLQFFSAVAILDTV